MIKLWRREIKLRREINKLWRRRKIKMKREMGR